MHKSNKQKGSVLVVILILGAIASIVFYAMTSFIVSQSRENQANQEKVNRSELEKYIVSALDDGLACADEFASTVYAFNPINPAAINLNQIARAGASAVVQVNANPTGRLVIQRIQIQISPVVAAPANNIYSGLLVVELAPGSLARPLKRLEIPMSFGARAVAGVYQLTSCGSEINVCAQINGTYIFGSVPACSRTAYVN